MRTNRVFTFRERSSAIKLLILNRLSLFYFKLFRPKAIWLIRDGGIGDAIMSTIAIVEFQKAYPKTQIYLVTNTPTIFAGFDLNIVETPKFPMISLTYGHYDLLLFKGRVKHIKAIIGETLGLQIQESDGYRLFINQDGFLQKNAIVPKTYVVIQPDASSWFKEKNWSIIQWNVLVERLRERSIQVHQIGAFDDALVKGCIDWRGKSSIVESLTLVKNAKLLIGVNSFGEQSAAAFGVPALVLYGPTNPSYSLNQGQIALCSSGSFDYESLKSIKYHFSNVSEISVDQVMDQALSILNR
ncbi:MAG: ADP-heptose:LPS heptosyltransferase [Roseivirga sp.]|jgi:ADP-heptose:LPS heptosyltransferase